MNTNTEEVKHIGVTVHLGERIGCRGYLNSVACGVLEQINNCFWQHLFQTVKKFAPVDYEAHWYPDQGQLLFMMSRLVDTRNQSYYAFWTAHSNQLTVFDEPRELNNFHSAWERIDFRDLVCLRAKPHDFNKELTYDTPETRKAFKKVLYRTPYNFRMYDDLQP